MKYLHTVVFIKRIIIDVDGKCKSRRWFIQMLCKSICTFIYPDKRKMHSFFRMYYALQQDKFLGNHT